MKLSRTERWILSNQLRILAALHPKEKSDYSQPIEALECGYELEYEALCQHIYKEKDCLNEEQCREVLDILGMWDALRYSYGRLEDKSGIELSRVQFPGFDGNNEPTYLGYTQHLRATRRYEHLHRGDNFNSHAPLLPWYRLMLEVWRAGGEKRELSKEEIVRLLAVKVQ